MAVTSVTRFRCVWTIAILFAASSVSPAQSSRQPLSRSDIERFSDSVFTTYLRESAEPSLAVVVTTGSAILFAKGYGSEDSRRRIAVDPEQTLFNIASVSKLFVATAVMQLVDAGKLGLEDRADTYVSGVTLHGESEPVRIRHLLTHTSGIDAPFMRGTVATPNELPGLDAYFTRYPPRLGREPGQEIRYSNDAMALAALIVERVSGERFDEYVERHIFGPLGMQRSSFRQPPPAPLAGRVATAGSGPVPNSLILYPVGSMVSTVADVARFIQAHLNVGVAGRAQVVSDVSGRAMHARQWSAHPAAPGVGLGFFESTLGGRRGLFHTGARVHFSLLYLVPDEGIGIFVVHSMRQGGPFQSLRADYVRGFVERFLATSWVQSQASENPASSARARSQVGIYRPILLSPSTIERAAWLVADTRVSNNDHGSLNVAIPGGETIRVYAEAPDVYRAREGRGAGLVIAFPARRDGRPLRMSLSGATQDPVSFEKLAWYQRGMLHAEILALAFAIIVSCCLFAGLRRIVAVLQKRADTAGPGNGAVDTPRVIWRLAVIASAIILCAPFAGAGVLIPTQSEAAAADGLRRALTTALSMLLAGCMLALVMPAYSIVSWRHHWWSRGQRVYFTVLAIAVAVFIPLLGYYHLLGVRM